TRVSHCPSSNLKLGSGIAPIAKVLTNGISVSLGADGAACNNRLDMFTEMRTAALLQKVLHGPEVLPAQKALELATIEGAKALGLDKEIGSLEVGKKGDLSVIQLDRLHTSPRPTDLLSAVVYSAVASDVKTVLVDGLILMRQRELVTLDERKVIEEANSETVRLMGRAGVN